MNLGECILFRDFSEGKILEDMVLLINDCEREQISENGKEILYRCMHGLVEMAGMYGFSGNLWHNYLTFLLVNHENAFSMACEIKGPVSGSINCLAEQDFLFLKNCMNLIWAVLIAYTEPGAVLLSAIMKM